MASVVDELTVSLGLDASAFKRGLADTRANLKTTAEASTVTAKEMQAQGKRAGEFFSGIKTEALSLLGVLVGSAGLGAFLKDTTTNLTALGYAAGNINLPVQELAAFRNMIAENGGSADAAQSSLLNLANTMQGLKLGLGAPGQFLAGLNVIGGTYQDTPMQILEKFARYSENVPKTQSNAIGRLLGLDQDTMNLTQRGVGYFMEHLHEAYQRGVPDQGMIDRMTGLYRATMDLGQAAKFAGQQLLDRLAPGLTATADKMTALIEKYPEQAQAIEAAIAALSLTPVALWVLRALGLATLGETLAGVTLWTAATTIAPLNEGEPAGTANSNLVGRATGNPNQKITRDQAVAFYVAHGYPQAAAEGLADAIGFESSFDAGSFNPAGGGTGARGLFNWRGDRTAAYVARYGHTPDAGTAEENLEFSNAELNGPYAGVGWKLMHAANREAALAIINQEYTKPGAPYGRAPAIPGPAAMHPAASSTNNSTSVHVDTINVNTQATDAKGISVDIHQAIVDSWMAQANRGLN